ncbi:MAG: type I restriction-modification enzyme R subunit C-terminal domain-containing protein, partial [Veillonella sp.]|nr:type I restriction-modification enzyme R subunit C-terminal domain-containing protein [Veillonella sp.]
DVKENLARGFDNFVYEGILNLISGQSLDYFKKRVISLSNTLLQKISIEQIRKKQDFLKLIKEDMYWQIVDELQLNHLRKELRDLIQFLDVAERRVIITTITDSVLLTREGDTLMPEVFESYQEKVESYFLTHQDHPAIQKLINNNPINEEDYKALKHIFTHDLGSPKDYEDHFKDKEFGLVVRDIVKMRPAAAEKAFSDLINTKSMNSDQINFIKQVINYITVNGYMESPKVLLEPPFDRPFDMWKLFDQVEAVEIANIVNQIKNNACIDINEKI